MLSGAIIKLPDDLDINQLNGLVWEREHNDNTLKSIIQFEGAPLKISNMTVHQALAIHEHVIQQPIMDENNGRYSINYQEVVTPYWANCFFSSGLAIVDRLNHRPFVIDIINHGFNNNGRRLVVPAHEVAIDTARMSNDHRDQWIRAFSERAGRVDKGTVYGDGVEQDTVFGPELGHANCRSVGWITEAFGDPVKVRVSPKGSVTVMTDLTPEVFLRFIRLEILPYVTHF